MAENSFQLPKFDKEMSHDFIAGCLGGFAGILVGHPADTVKVRMQAQTPSNIRYHSTTNCFVQIVQKEGVTGLYKGIVAPMYGQVFINAIVFGIYGGAKRGLNLGEGLKAESVAGALAGFVESFVVSPVELIKTRMQLQGEGEKMSSIKCYKGEPYKYSSPMDCLTKVIRHENGFRGLYRGLSLTILREVPGFASYFGSFYYLCDKIGAMKDDGEVHHLKLLFCGGSAGIVSWCISYPQDVIKTRIQMDGMGKTIYKGIFHCAEIIYAEEGVKGFFKGLNACNIRAFPTNAATLATATLYVRYMTTRVNKDKDLVWESVHPQPDQPRKIYNNKTKSIIKNYKNKTNKHEVQRATKK